MMSMSRQLKDYICTTIRYISLCICTLDSMRIIVWQLKFTALDIHRAQNFYINHNNILIGYCMVKKDFLARYIAFVAFLLTTDVKIIIRIKLDYPISRLKLI